MPASCAHHSRNVDRPFFDKKIVIGVVLGVLMLHGVIAIGLSNMTIPDIKPPKITPPLEIIFVTPPPPVEVKPEEIKPQEVKPVPKVTPLPKVEPIKLPPNAESTKNTSLSKLKTTEKIIPQSTEQKSTTDISQDKIDKDRQDKIDKDRQDKIDKDRQDKIDKDRQDKIDKDHQDKIDKDRQDKIDKDRQDKINKDRQDKINKDHQDKINKDHQDKIISNTPVTISAGQAHWKSKPNFDLECGGDEPEGKTLSGVIRYSVDKQGNTTTTLAKSTGNREIDKVVLKQARYASFYPYTKNDIPVLSIVNYPFTVSCN